MQSDPKAVLPHVSVIGWSTPTTYWRNLHQHGIMSTYCSGETVWLYLRFCWEETSRAQMSRTSRTGTGLYITVGKSQNKRLLHSLTQSNVSSGILFSEQIQSSSHPQFNGLAAGSKEMKNCVAASNACTFISTSKPMGGQCHNCPHFLQPVVWWLRNAVHNETSAECSIQPRWLKFI